MPVFTRTLPFHVKPTTADYMRGIYRIEGLVRYEAGTLHLEYRCMQAGSFEFSEVETRQLPLRDLREIQPTINVFVVRLTLLAGSLRLFEDLPGTTNDRLVLHFPRRERRAADAFAAFLRAERSEILLREE